MTDKHSPIPAAIQAEAFDWLLHLQAAPDDVQLRQRFEAWLSSDARHEDAFREAERTWQVTGQLQRGRSSGRSAEAAQQESRSRGWRKRWSIPAALAACLLVLIAAPRVSVLVQADHHTAVGDRETVTLADGSTATLNTDSAIQTDYGPEVRRIRLLQGEAFFDVSRDRQRRFRVRVGEQTVRVTGTAFNVRVDSDELRVGVARGHVRVGRGATETTLVAGERWTLERASGEASMETVAPAQVADWRDGRLAVAGRSVAELVAELERYHRGRIWLVDDRLASHYVTGSYNLDTPEAALRAVVEPHGGRVRAITPYLLLLTSP